jgi:hypothetical protein
MILDLTSRWDALIKAIWLAVAVGGAVIPINIP